MRWRQKQQQPLGGRAGGGNRRGWCCAAAAQAARRIPQTDPAAVRSGPLPGASRVAVCLSMASSHFPHALRSPTAARSPPSRPPARQGRRALLPRVLPSQSELQGPKGAVKHSAMRDQGREANRGWMAAAGAAAVPGVRQVPHWVPIFQNGSLPGKGCHAYAGRLLSFLGTGAPATLPAGLLPLPGCQAALLFAVTEAAPGALPRLGVPGMWE